MKQHTHDFKFIARPPKEQQSMNLRFADGVVPQWYRCNGCGTLTIRTVSTKRKSKTRKKGRK